jgi:peptide/nickel transport system permease protein
MHRHFLLKRCLELIPLILGVIVINFSLIHLAPGDPAMVLAGEFQAGPEVLQELRVEFGLDKPLYEQFLVYLRKVCTGDLGYSYRYRSAVLSLILSRLPNTLLLLAVSFVLSFVVGIAFAAFAAHKPNSLLDTFLSALSMIGYCLPTFWTGMMLLTLFSLRLEWFPSGGMYSLKADFSGMLGLLDLARHLFLPAVTYSAFFLAISYRLTRAKMIEMLMEDFITTARSKGLSEGEVLFRHALKNSLVPVIAVMGLNLGVMVGGSVTIETVFSWPGLGRLMYDSILSRDYPLLLGIFIIFSVGVILANLIADIWTAVLDPRIKY